MTTELQAEADLLTTCGDPNIEAVIALLMERSAGGVKKYGCTTFDARLTLEQWLQHALEEALDTAVYLQSALRVLRDRSVGCCGGAADGCQAGPAGDCGDNTSEETSR